MDNRKRSFILGSEWIYVKIYIGESVADSVLVGILFPLLEKMTSEKAIDKYFFIRYADSNGFHIRLRLHTNNSDNISIAINALKCAFEVKLEQRIVKNIVFDTYVREIERYDYVDYETTESIFYYDSRCQLKILSLLQNNEDPKLRWQTALLIMNDLVDLFGYEDSAKMSLFTELRDSYRGEFNCENKFILDNHNQRYRDNRSVIENAMSRNIPGEIDELLQERKMNISKLLERTPRISNSKDKYVSSLAHMSVNRFFQSSNRKCETVLYEYLCKYYRSVIARKKSN